MSKTTSVGLRRFNSEGRDRFAKLLAERPPDLFDQIDVLCSDTQYSLPVSTGGEPVAVEIAPIVRRYELALHLDRYFGPTGPLAAISGDAEVWNWLSAVWLRTLVEASDLELEKALGKEKERWILTSNILRYHRHLLSSPFFALDLNRQAPQNAMCLLATPVLAPGELVERISGKRSLSTGSVCHLATLLYYDENTGALRSGHTSRPGNPKMFSYFFSQVDLNVDYVGMSTTELLSILPSNFDRWKKHVLTRLD